MNSEPGASLEFLPSYVAAKTMRVMRYATTIHEGVKLFLGCTQGALIHFRSNGIFLIFLHSGNIESAKHFFALSYPLCSDPSELS